MYFLIIFFNQEKTFTVEISCLLLFLFWQYLYIPLKTKQKEQSPLIQILLKI